MQPGSQPEDIHTILSRFHTWTGKNPGIGNTKNVAPETASVREIPYEEAMCNFRQRQKAQTRRVAASAARPVAAALAAPSEPGPANPDEALTGPLAAARPADTALPEAPTEARAEPAALARRPPACLTKAAPTLPSDEKKVARKKVGPQAKTACAQPAAVSAVRAVQPKAAPAANPKPATQTKPEPRRAGTAKESAAAAVRPRTAGPKKPVFKKILAKTIRTAPTSAQSTRKTVPAPDRNRRITTRFTTAEQRRLELAAEQAGLTVSAWLRQCALHAEKASVPTAPAAPIKTAKSAGLAQPAVSTLFSTPAPSAVGNWLTLLRQRFLSSPARFSERA